MSFVEGVPLGVWLLTAGGGLLMLTLSVVRNRGRIILGALSFMLCITAAMTAPLTVNEGAYYSGMVTMQLIYGTLAMISAIILIAAILTAWREGEE